MYPIELIEGVLCKFPRGDRDEESRRNLEQLTPLLDLAEEAGDMRLRDGLKWCIDNLHMPSWAPNIKTAYWHSTEGEAYVLSFMNKRVFERKLGAIGSHFAFPGMCDAIRALKPY